MRGVERGGAESARFTSGVLRAGGVVMVVFVVAEQSVARTLSEDVLGDV